MNFDSSEFALIFKALGDETRLRIVTMLSKGKTCACKILEEFCFTQPTLSYHMKQLTDSGLIDAQREGKWVHYSINDAKLEKLREFFSAM